MTEARDIFEACYSIYVSTYDFEEKKKAITEYLDKVAYPALDRAALYASLQNRDHATLARIAQTINTLINKAMFKSIQDNSIR